MSESESTPILESPAEMPPPPPRRRLRRFFLRHLPLSLGGLALLSIIAVTGLGVWVSSAAFESLVRKNLVLRLETATGGRVEIGAFHWRPFRLEADVDKLVIHGREAANEAPYARVEHLRIAVSVLGFWSPRVLLRSLEIEQPGLHLIVYPDGSTNQPRPRQPAHKGKPALDTLFDLKASHLLIDQGEVDYEDRAAAFDFQDRFTLLDFDASAVTLRVAYAAPSNGNPESYRIEAAAGRLNTFRRVPRPLAQSAQGSVQATVDLTRGAVYLRTLRLSAGGHDLVVSGTLEDFAHPHWQATVVGDLDMRLLEPVTGYPFTPKGTAHLDLAGAGHAGVFRADGSVHVDGGSYIGTGVYATGVGLDAHVHADPGLLLIDSIVVRLRQGGQIAGEVSLAHWLPPIPGTATLQPAAPLAPHGKSGKAKPVRPPPPSSQIDIPVDGKVTANFRDVALDTILEMVCEPPFQRLGLNTRVNGPATANWVKGDVNTLSVVGTLPMSLPDKSVPGEVPTSGMVDGTYFQRDGSVDLRKLEIHMPQSQLTAQGHLGAYPMSSPTAMAVDLHSQNLFDFDQVLRDLGLVRGAKSGAAALPVKLDGQADFHGNWAGSLVDPLLTGDLKATQLAVEIPTAPTGPPAAPQIVKVDSIHAAGSYSAARIDIVHSQLRRGPAEIDIDGSLIATPAGPAPKKGVAPAPSFDAGSVLHGHVRASGVGMNQVLPFTGQNLPLTGILNAQIEANGPIRTLAGTGWIELDGGSFYSEPISRVRAQGQFSGPTIKLSSLTVSEKAGNVAATGSIDLKTHAFKVDAKGSGIDVARVEWLHAQGWSVTGSLGFTLAGSGTLDDPRLEGHARLANLALSGEPLGELEFTAHTANRSATYDMTTRLEAAALTLRGQTALGGDNTTHAQLEFSRFNIGGLLRSAHVPGLNGESALAGTVTLDGPMAKPEQLRGEAHIQEMAVTVAGVHLKSEGGAHATMAGGRINLDPLHVTGEETDLRAQGSLELRNKRQLDLAASGAINLKIAESLDPDLTAKGSTTFQVEMHGPVQNPELRGRIDFQNGSLALEDLPNGLSQIHGTLEFNQNRLEVKSLTAMTGGGLISVGGYLAYQHGIYADLNASGNGVRIRYPAGVSSLADARLRLQGSQNNLILSGDVLITRFSVSPDLDIASLAAQSNSVPAVASPDAPSNHVRLDVHVVSSPQLNFQNAYAKLAGDVDLRLRGTLASPSLLGRVSVTEGSATIAGTRYELQHGEISFTNPVRIEPAIDLNATAHVEDYDITLGLHGTPSKLAVSYRSDPPLPEADVVALLALGRTESQQRIYTAQQEQSGANPTTDALLGGALNATVSSRVQKLFGAGSVKVDPNYLGALGNSTSRIIVEEQLGTNVTLTYATNVNTTAQQLLQAEVAINRHVSLMVARDESGVFSMVLKATRRYR
jgi:translocation and assembly module TamB